MSEGKPAYHCVWNTLSKYYLHPSPGVYHTALHHDSLNLLVDEADANKRCTSKTDVE